MARYGLGAISLVIGTAVLFLPIPHNAIIGFSLLAIAAFMAVSLYVSDKRKVAAKQPETPPTKAVTLSVHGGPAVYFDGVEGVSLNVWNIEKKRDTTADAVTASMEFRHIDGKRHKSTSLWYSSQPGGGVGAWTERTSIPMGDDPSCLPIFYWEPNSAAPRAYFLIDKHTMNVNPYGVLLNVNNPIRLEYGEWTAALKLNGDNVEEEWTMTINLEPTRYSCSPPTKRF